jgi:hypothetical protein
MKENQNLILDLDTSRHIKNFLPHLPQLRAVLPGEGPGIFTISNLESENVEGKFILDGKEKNPNLYFPSLEIWMPLPRPQTGKKIFHILGAFGVQSVHFFLPDPKNRGYLTSGLYRGLTGNEILDSAKKNTQTASQNLKLNPEIPDIPEDIKTGMSQTGSWIIPHLDIIHENFSYLQYYQLTYGSDSPGLEIPSSDTNFTDGQNQYGSEEKVIFIFFDPRGETPLSDFLGNQESKSGLGDTQKKKKSPERYVLIFGPENGFTDSEVRILRKFAKGMHLGPWPMRTEFAFQSVVWTIRNFYASGLK